MRFRYVAGHQFFGIKDARDNVIRRATFAPLPPIVVAFSFYFSFIQTC